MVLTPVRSAPALRLDGLVSTRLLQRRVDALVIAYRVELTDAMRERLRERQAVAQEHGRSELEVYHAADDGRAAFRGELRRTRSVERHYVENGDVRVVIDLLAPVPEDRTKRKPPEDDGEAPMIEPLKVGWTVEVTARASWLAVTELDAAIEIMGRVAQAFGYVHGERLRRFDLAADFSGWSLLPVDGDAWVKPRRAKIGAYIPDIAHEETDDRAELEEQGAPAGTLARMYRDRRGRVTGFTVGQGGALSMRLYDKRAELRLPQSEHKRELEYTIWSRAGWVEPKPEDDDAERTPDEQRDREDAQNVSRLEFQARGEALDEMDLRDPRKLSGMIDRVWAYCVRKWVRLVLPDERTRLSRCPVDPRWLEAQAVVFFHRATPITRLRRRGAATLAQAIGGMLSLLGQHGELAGIGAELRRYGDEGKLVRSMSERGREATIDSIVGDLTDMFRNLAVRELAKSAKSRGAKPLEKLIVAIRAADARFAPAEGPGEPGKPPT